MSPLPTDLRRPGFPIGTREAVPSTSAEVRTTCEPLRRSTIPPAILPTRIFGPGRSWSIAMILPPRLASLRMVATSCRWLALSPCEKLILKTSTWGTSLRTTRGGLLAGPMVQTIFVFRNFLGRPTREGHDKARAFRRIRPF